MEEMQKETASLLEKLKTIRIQSSQCSKEQTSNLQDSKCPHCDGTGWIMRIDENGMEFCKSCECRNAAIEKAKLKFADIPEHFKDMKLENFSAGVYQKEESKGIIRLVCSAVKEYVESFSEYYNQGIGLYMYSNTRGSGKTRMAVSIANKLLENKYKVKFAISTTIINEIKNTWNKENKYSESKLLNDLSTVDILIIDDFGTEKISDWVNDKYYYIINERYINRKVTIFTSNDSLQDVNYDSRITNRILEKTLELRFPEESIREHIARKNNEDIIKKIKGE